MAEHIVSAVNDNGAIHLHKTTDGFRFFIKEEKYPSIAGVTIQEADLRRLSEEIAKYFDELDLERYKTSFCQIDNKYMTIYQYASDVLGSRYKADNWFKRQHSSTLEEVETNLRQIEHGVFG